MKQIVEFIKKKINQQDQFIRACIYTMGGFSIILVGYGVGRLVGTITF